MKHSCTVLQEKTTLTQQKAAIKLAPVVLVTFRHALTSFRAIGGVISEELRGFYLRSAFKHRKADRSTEQSKNSGMKQQSKTSDRQ